MSIQINSWIKKNASIPALLVVVMLGGCATFSQDGGIDAVNGLTKARAGHDVKVIRNDTDISAVDAEVETLLAQPLDAERAVQIALMNNRGLQAKLAELGISEAELVQAGRLRNPGFGFGRMGSGPHAEIERSVTFDLIGLITMPARINIERRRFEQVQQQSAMEAVRVAYQARRAFYSAVAAKETVRYMEQVKDAAEAGAELARQMGKAGNWSKLEQSREHAFYAEATAQLARARHAALAAREELMRVLGVWRSATTLTLPERLPDLPKEPRKIADLERQAIAQRLDVQSAKRDTHALAASLGLTRKTGVIDALEVSYLNESVPGEPRENGYEVHLELPIFDWGGARNAKAQALYMQSVHRAADTAIRARSNVRETYSAYRTSYDLARHYRDEIVPLRKKISDEMLLRYNGMLVSVFELLADAREQVTSVNTSIDALKDFWLADAALHMALHGGEGSAMTFDSKATTAAGNAAH